MKFRTKILCWLAPAFVALAASAEERVVWLDEIDPQDNYVQDWGCVEINRSVVGTPLSIGGRKFERGIGGHAISRMLFDLGGKAQRVQGLAGPDDNNLFATRLDFKVIGDGKELWGSGVMERGDSAKPFDVDLVGVDKVLLLIDMCDDEFMYDHADWAEVKFITDGADVKSIPVWPAAVKKEPYILTPKAPATPQINNPKVYGATPGADFLWSVDRKSVV